MPTPVLAILRSSGVGSVREARSNEALAAAEPVGARAGPEEDDGARAEALGHFKGEHAAEGRPADDRRRLGHRRGEAFGILGKGLAREWVNPGR